MNKQLIQTSAAPAAIGTYSQAIQSGQLVFLSGQIGLEPESMSLNNATIEAEIDQLFKNLTAVCTAANASLNHIVKLTIYLTDFDHYPILNNIMENYFTAPYPARAVVGVVCLPKGARVEADAILQLN